MMAVNESILGEAHLDVIAQTRVKWDIKVPVGS